MKLIFCPACEDVVRLREEEARSCFCKKSGGRYENRKDALVWGEAIPLGFTDLALMEALGKNASGEFPGSGTPFHAFVISMPCQTIERVKQDDPRLSRGGGPKEVSF